MSSKEIVNMTATDMVDSIKNRKISVSEVMDAHLAQIDFVNPKVNAIVTLHAELGLEGAKLADEAIAKGDDLGILHGLPTAHKDLVPTKGILTTYGSPLYADYVPDHSALIVERMQGAGAITIGKTNTPEFGAVGKLGLKSVPAPPAPPEPGLAVAPTAPAPPPPPPASLLPPVLAAPVPPVLP